MGIGRTAVGSVTLSRVTGTGNIDVSTNGGTTWTTVSVTGARVSVSLTGNINGQFAIRIVTSGDAVEATYPQLEDVTAQTTQTAGEYVSVGVTSAPYYHGSFVDGVKCFPTDLSGNPLTTMERYKPEAAATQIIAATADIRDMTGVNWVLGATMTRARTSVGADGAANSANRLTGGAVAATNTILYTVTAAASSRTYSALVKRVTGTGPVRIIQTGTETDISSQLNTAGYALVQLNASVLNVAIGFKIDTNGDAIDVDMNQFEAGTFATSRILTGGGVRNADVLTYTGGDIPNLKTLCVTFRRESGAASVGVVVTHGDGTSNERAYADMASATALQFAGYDGGVLQWDTTASNAYVPGTVAKLAFSQATNDLKMAFNGVAQTADTSATMPTNTQLQVGHVNGAFQLSGNVGGIYGWTRNFSQSELNAITAL
jgi:hypothetical protein